MTWRFILSQVFRGYSAGRALMHLRVQRDVEMTGTVLDVGGGSRQTYIRHLDMTRLHSLVTADIDFPGMPPVASIKVQASVTNLPFRSGSLDTLLCFNLLEHVYDYRGALSEIRRVLREGGVLYGWVPFILGVHGAPQDYWRYTDESLCRLLSESGFTALKVENVGGTFLSIYDLVRPYCRLWFLGKVLRVMLVAVALMMTWFVRKIPAKMGFPRPESAPTGIWFVATAR